MLRFISRTSLVVTCLLGLASAAVAAPAKDVMAARKAIQAAYNQKNLAIARKDSATIWSLRTKDFIAISKDGQQQSVAELKPREAHLFAIAKAQHGSSVIQKFTLRQNQAAVVVNEAGTVVMVNPRTNEESVLRMTGRYLETWVKQNGQWRTSRSQTLSNAISVNGHPVPQ